jgi:hypothetical protein
MVATKQRDGQIIQTLSSPFAKNISLFASGKSVVSLRASHPRRGGSRSSRTRGGMRWTRRLRLTSAADADGEVVWSWRPDAGVKLVERSASDGGKTAGHRGEREVSRKPLRREGRMPPLNLYARVRISLCSLHTRPRVQRAPGLPCALCFRGGSR